MKTSEALYATADHIATFGHASDRAYDTSSGLSIRTAPSCMIGAVYVAAPEVAPEAVRVVNKYVAPLTIPDYNKIHTAEEVIETLRACAVIEEAREEALEKVTVPA